METSHVFFTKNNNDLKYFYFLSDIISKSFISEMSFTSRFSIYYRKTLVSFRITFFALQKTTIKLLTKEINVKGLPIKSSVGHCKKIQYKVPGFALDAV